MWVEDQPLGSAEEPIRGSPTLEVRGRVEWALHTYKRPAEAAQAPRRQQTPVFLHCLDYDESVWSSSTDEDAYVEQSQ